MAGHPIPEGDASHVVLRRLRRARAREWFSYRRRTRERPVIGGRQVSTLQDIQAETWQPEYTSELIDLLNVLGLLAELEPQQAGLLDRIVEGPQITVTDLTEAGVLPVPKTHESRRRNQRPKAPRPRRSTSMRSEWSWALPIASLSGCAAHGADLVALEPGGNHGAAKLCGSPESPSTGPRESSPTASGPPRVVFQFQCLRRAAGSSR